MSKSKVIHKLCFINFYRKCNIRVRGISFRPQTNVNVADS